MREESQPSGKFAYLLREAGQDPIILRGGMGAKSRAAALARLQRQPGGPPLLIVATGPYAGEGFDCPALDTLFLALDQGLIAEQEIFRAVLTSPQTKAQHSGSRASR
jgi:superfamily II DNA or RNA helicase